MEMMKKIKKILIGLEVSIKQTLKHMDEEGEKTLFVVDKDNKLLGVVTDGDIRRWILKNGSLNEAIGKVMNKNPLVLEEGYSTEEAKKLMISTKIECIPIVNDKKIIISAVWWVDLFEEKVKEYKAINIPVVIMAGGEGARLSPFTKILPKPLIPIGEKPIIEVIIDKFMKYGCKKFYLSVNYKSNIIKAYFKDFKHEYDIEYVQEEKPLGTIGSLYLLKNKIKSTFFVTNCDILIETDYAEIFKFHNDNENKITLVASMKHYTIPYGVCEIVKGGVLKRITEKPEYDFLVNAGLYILEPETLKNIPENNFYQMIDLIQDCKNKVGVYPVSEKSWFDMGQLEELQDMLKRFGVK